MLRFHHEPAEHWCHRVLRDRAHLVFHRASAGAATVNRRNFLRTMIGGGAATVAVRTFPFRVFSFPAENPPFKVSAQELRDSLKEFHKHIDSFVLGSRPFAIGDEVTLTGLGFPLHKADGLQNGVYQIKSVDIITFEA